MPKGEHFKKDNPRIIQVSFKVNKKEHEELKLQAHKIGKSVPEWIRERLTKVKEEKKEKKEEYVHPVLSAPAKKIAEPDKKQLSLF